MRQAQIFVGTLGASNDIYAEATWTQRLPDWTAADVRIYEACGAVPVLAVPDYVKTGVRHACYYEPDLNPTYQDLALLPSATTFIEMSPVFLFSRALGRRILPA